MKTIMDAVNDLKGDLDSCEYTAKYWQDLGFKYLCESDSYTKGKFVFALTKNHGENTICSIYAFNELVTELSNWQPTLPKVETVEREGMVYEIGKIYEFRDNDRGWYADVLVAAENGTSFPFESVSTVNRFCRECQSTLGTITPAPTKLIDGEAYMFDCQGETRMGFKFGEYLRIDKYTKFSIELCTNIKHLTEVK